MLTVQKHRQILPKITTKDIIHYQYESNAKEILEIEIIDVYGRTLSKKEISSEVSLNKILVDLSQYPPAGYMIRVHHINSGQVHTTKAIRNR